jgi:hypothetical protein
MSSAWSIWTSAFARLCGSCQVDFEAGDARWVHQGGGQRDAVPGNGRGDLTADDRLAGFVMRIQPSEFLALPLRVHALLHDVPLEDAWAVPLSGGGSGRTIEDVRAVMVEGIGAAPAVVQGLFRIRRTLGRLLGWDRERAIWNTGSAVDRLSPSDRARSLVTPGSPDGHFRLLYRFEDEQLGELRNATVHAFLSLSIRPTARGYVAYLGVFVRPVHRLTWVYMGAIAPFRRLLVYPALIRTMQRAWAARYRDPAGETS